MSGRTGSAPSSERRPATCSRPIPTRCARRTRASCQRARIEALGGIPSEFFPGPPDLAFEVSSPRDRRGEVESKTRSWLDAGTLAVVVVDPRRRIATIHRPPGASQSYSGPEILHLGDVLPGFAPTVDDLLA